MRARNVLIIAAALAGCAFDNGGTTTNDAGGGNNGSDDAGMGSGSSDPGPCMLPALGLTADTLAGCADAGTADGPRGMAKFSNPVNVALGPSGIAYVVDFDSSLLRKVDLDGSVTTLFKDPRFNRPFGILIAPDGWLYIECDNDMNDGHGATSGTIWKINPADPSGANAQPVITGLMRPRGLALMSNNKLAITDYLSMQVEIGDPATGTVTPLAGAYGVATTQNGKGAGATFNVPWDLVVASDGSLIVTDWGDHTLRRVAMDGTVTTYAGTAGVAGHADGPLATATFNNPKGLTKDASGAIYVSDSTNHTIRKISNGMVTTIAGVTSGGYLDSNDPMTAEYYGIEGLDVSADGKRLVIADGNNGDGSAFNHVRVLTLP
ncbi:MAG: hypothetical protein ABI467_10575 [Kofleriaceae bacterium]